MERKGRKAEGSISVGFDVIDRLSNLGTSTGKSHRCRLGYTWEKDASGWSLTAFIFNRSRFLSAPLECTSRNDLQG